MLCHMYITGSQRPPKTELLSLSSNAYCECFVTQELQTAKNPKTGLLSSKAYSYECFAQRVDRHFLKKPTNFSFQKKKTKKQDPFVWL